MKVKNRLALLLLLPLFAFTSAHKYYVSVTTVNYSQKDDALQITTRIFIDDMDRVLEERYGLKAKLNTPEEDQATDSFIAKYFRAKLLVRVDGKERRCTFLGKRYDTDMVVCYLEIPKAKLAKASSIEIQNELLTDVFEEQQNVVNFKWNGKKKSFLLVKESNKGTLKL
ncbi:hypothetical protein K8352_10655 [Flavobacteriaceae bacterium F89]|uniref:Peptidase E n=1 Tax=Cerina litoralis TaxID=2874477 RepID=A0AAE3EVR4_9FLAO|nr:DUF6702 family protein [Cerina litoralis]MCG2461209.1 hypothetical protein [Cerina litoralis]